MEAPPDRPGHVGHTPQPVAPQLRAARHAGVAASTLARVFGRDSRSYAMQAFPRMMTPERWHSLAVTIQIERTRQTLSKLQPWPSEFEPGFAPDLVARRNP